MHEGFLACGVGYFGRDDAGGALLDRLHAQETTLTTLPGLVHANSVIETVTVLMLVSDYNSRVALFLLTRQKTAHVDGTPAKSSFGRCNVSDGGTESGTELLAGTKP